MYGRKGERDSIKEFQVLTFQFGQNCLIKNGERLVQILRMYLFGIFNFRSKILVLDNETVTLLHGVSKHVMESNSKINRYTS